MLTEETAIKLIRRELGLLPDRIMALCEYKGEVTTYFAYMGRYPLTITACDEKTLQMRIWRCGQSISTYYDAETLKEDETRTQIERRAAHAETVRNAILKHGVDWCRQVYDDWETVLQVELDDAMGLGLYPDPEKAIDCT